MDVYTIRRGNEEELDRADEARANLLKITPK